MDLGENIESIAGVTADVNGVYVDLSNYDTNVEMNDLLKIKVEYWYKSKSDHNVFMSDELLIEMIDTCTIQLDRDTAFDATYEIPVRKMFSKSLPSFLFGYYCSDSNFVTTYEY